MAILSKPKFWFQTKAWRIALVVIGVVVVLGLVIFNKQLANLTSLFGSKASITQDHAYLDKDSFLPGHTAEPCANRFTVTDNSTSHPGRLMLNDDSAACQPTP